MGGTGKSRRGGKRAQKKWRGEEAWLERKGEGPFSQIKGGTGAPLTVILRPLLVEDDVCRQFEVPPLAAVVAPLAVEGGVGEVGWVAGGPWELGEPWEGVAGLGREEEVAGRVAGLGALSLTDSHSDAPLVLVPSEGVGAVGKVSRLQAGWTRYLRGRGTFCKERVGVKEKRLSRQPPTSPTVPNRKKRKVWALEGFRKTERRQAKRTCESKARDRHPERQRERLRPEVRRGRQKSSKATFILHSHQPL